MARAMMVSVWVVRILICGRWTLVVIRVMLKRRKGSDARVRRRARRPIGLVLLNGRQCRARHRGRRGVVLGFRVRVRGDGRLRRRVVVGRRGRWWARVCGRWARWRGSIKRPSRMGRIHNADGRAMRSRRCRGSPGAMIRRLLRRSIVVHVALHRESLGGGTPVGRHHVQLGSAPPVTKGWLAATLSAHPRCTGQEIDARHGRTYVPCPRVSLEQASRVERGAEAISVQCRSAQHPCLPYHPPAASTEQTQLACTSVRWQDCNTERWQRAASTDGSSLLADVVMAANAPCDASYGRAHWHARIMQL